MSASVHVGGSWKNVAGINVYVGGAWKTVTNGWVYVGGAWKKFFPSFAATLSNLTITRTVTGGGAANATITVDADGYVYATTAGGGFTQRFQWLTGGGVAGDYSVGYTTLVSGTTPSSGAALNVFSALSSSRSWANNQAGGGSASKTSVLTMQIRETVSGNVLASATFTLTAAVEP